MPIMLSAGDPKDLECGLTGSHHQDDSWPSTSDFVKKLYNILDDPAVEPIVSWGPKGDCFVVKSVNEFSKTILPRLYNHSNFASFVRQLNKYDFHKVKNMDGNTFDEHSWAFCHPDFLPDRREALENIKRKGPTQRMTHAAQAAATVAIIQQQQQQQAAAAAALLGGSSTVSALTSNVKRLQDDNEELKRRLRILEESYRDVLVKMVGFQQAMVQQDDVMQSIVGHMLGANDCCQQLSPRPTPRLTSQQQQKGHQAPPPYSTQSQQSQSGGIGGYGLPTGGLLTPSSSVCSPEFLASLPTGDVPMQDIINCSLVDLSTPNQPESPSSPISHWDFPPPNVYLANSGCGNGAPLSGPSGEDLGGLGNVGMSLGEGSLTEYDIGMGEGSANQYGTW
ncbi:HSF-type DNA-binding-domain-containing protein [Coprinopsis sp. MPI-PUGE-AT-0042]|nr:HSF-type DNA-binding-domain-containing protein [Coprinopsis sp. MPI-PUGE-AT-0042]